MTKARTVSASRRKLKRAPTIPLMPEGLMPPVQTMAKQGHEILRIEKHGPKVYRRTGENLLDRLARCGTITKRQAEAGHRYEEDHIKVWGSAGSRDSTIPPVGGTAHEIIPQAERIVRARDRLNRVLNLCGPGAYAVMRSVAIYGERLGRNEGATVVRYERLRLGLDAAAEVFGVPEYDRDSSCAYSA